MQSKDLTSYIISKPRFAALEKLINNNEQSVFLSGLKGSAAAAFLAPLIDEKVNKNKNQYIFVLNDLEEAGYFFHYLTQISGTETILFFPSAY